MSAHLFVCVSPPENDEKAMAKKRGKTDVSSSTSTNDVPPCSCGAPRVFECQILPSVLHVLNVDKHAKQSSAASTKLNDWYSSGGMDFGSIAIYTCSKPGTCDMKEQFVVVQDTAEDQPKVPPNGFQHADDAIVDENDAAMKLDEDEEMDG